MPRTLFVALATVLAVTVTACDRRQGGGTDAVKTSTVTPGPAPVTHVKKGDEPQPVPVAADGGQPGPPGCAIPGKCYFIGCDANPGMNDGVGMLAHYRARHPESCQCGFEGDGTREAFDRHLREKHPKEADAVIAAGGKREKPTPVAVAAIRLVRVDWQGSVTFHRGEEAIGRVPGQSMGTAATQREVSGKVDTSALFDEACLKAALEAPQGMLKGSKEWLVLEANDGWVLAEVACPPQGEELARLWEQALAASEKLGLKR